MLKRRLKDTAQPAYLGQQLSARCATRNYGNQATRLRLPSEGVVASLTMKNDNPLFPVVSERWGFGMSPPKPRWSLSPLSCKLWLDMRAKYDEEMESPRRIRGEIGGVLKIYRTSNG